MCIFHAMTNKRYQLLNKQSFSAQLAEPFVRYHSYYFYVMVFLLLGCTVI